MTVPAPADRPCRRITPVRHPPSPKRTARQSPTPRGACARPGRAFRIRRAAADEGSGRPVRRRLRSRKAGRRPAQTVEKPLWGGLEGRSPPNTIRTRRHVRRVRKPCAARFPCTFPRPRPRAQGKRVLAEKAGSAGLFRQAGRSSRKRRGRRKAGHAGRARARRFGPACGPTRPGFPANSYRSLSPFAPVCRKAARSGEARRLPPRLDRPRQPCYLCVQHSGNAEAKRRCGCG